MLVALVGFAHPLLAWAMAPLRAGARRRAGAALPGLLPRAPVAVLARGPRGGLARRRGRHGLEHAALRRALAAAGAAGRRGLGRDRAAGADAGARRSCPSSCWCCSSPACSIARWPARAGSSGASATSWRSAAWPGCRRSSSTSRRWSCSSGAGCGARSRGLPRAWARGLWAALLLGLVALLPLLPLDALGQRSDLLVDRGSPSSSAGSRGCSSLVRARRVVPAGRQRDAGLPRGRGRRAGRGA